MQSYNKLIMNLLAKNMQGKIKAILEDNKQNLENLKIPAKVEEDYSEEQMEKLLRHFLRHSLNVEFVITSVVENDKELPFALNAGKQVPLRIIILKMIKSQVDQAKAPPFYWHLLLIYPSQNKILSWNCFGESPQLVAYLKRSDVGFIWEESAEKYSAIGVPNSGILAVEMIRSAIIPSNGIINIKSLPSNYNLSGAAEFHSSILQQSNDNQRLEAQISEVVFSRNNTGAFDNEIAVQKNFPAKQKPYDPDQTEYLLRQIVQDKLSSASQQLRFDDQALIVDFELQGWDEPDRIMRLLDYLAVKKWEQAIVMLGPRKCGKIFALVHVNTCNKTLYCFDPTGATGYGEKIARALQCVQNSPYKFFSSSPKCCEANDPVLPIFLVEAARHLWTASNFTAATIFAKDFNLGAAMEVHKVALNDKKMNWWRPENEALLQFIKLRAEMPTVAEQMPLKKQRVAKRLEYDQDDVQAAAANLQNLFAHTTSQPPVLKPLMLTAVGLYSALVDAVAERVAVFPITQMNADGLATLPVMEERKYFIPIGYQDQQGDRYLLLYFIPGALLEALGTLYCFCPFGEGGVPTLLKEKLSDFANIGFNVKYSQRNYLTEGQYEQHTVLLVKAAEQLVARGEGIINQNEDIFVDAPSVNVVFA